METIKGLFTPQVFNPLSFIVVIANVLAGVGFIALFGSIEIIEDGSFRCDIGGEKKDYIQGLCLAEYLSDYNKGFPLYAFSILNLVAIVTVCAVYSRYAKDKIPNRSENIDVENGHVSHGCCGIISVRPGQVSPTDDNDDQTTEMPPTSQSHRLYCAYVIQLLSRLFLGILFPILQTQVLYPLKFPSQYCCTLTGFKIKVMQQNKYYYSLICHDVQAANKTLWTEDFWIKLMKQSNYYGLICHNVQATKKAFWTEALWIINVVAVALIVIELLVIICKIMRVVHFREDKTFCAKYLLIKETVETRQSSRQREHTVRIVLENTYSNNEGILAGGGTDEISPDLIQEKYTRTLKSSIKKQTEPLKKMLETDIHGVKIDEIFTSVMIRRENIIERDLQDDRYYQPPGDPIRFCTDIFKPLRTNVEDHLKTPPKIFLYGKAGIGKSIFCQKLIRDWSEDKFGHTDEEDYEIPDFKFAYLLTFRHLNKYELDKRFNLRDLLNTCPLLDEESSIDELLYENCIAAHSQQVLIILDGLDEYKYRSEVVGEYEIGFSTGNRQTEMPVPALLGKLIRGKLLRDAVVLVTSRNSGVGDLIFDETLQITGFSFKQVNEYVDKYFHEKESIRKTVRRYLEENDILASFGHVPVMCFFMCYYFDFHYDKSGSQDNIDLAVASTTDLYKEVVQMFMDKQHQHSRLRDQTIAVGDQTQEVIQVTLGNLSKLAAEFLLKKKYIFDDDDLMKFQLSIQEIDNLKVSGLLCCFPIRREAARATQEMSFTHLTLQEYLAAYYFVKIRKIIPSSVEYTVTCPQEIDENDTLRSESTPISDMLMLFMAGLSKYQENGETFIEKVVHSTGLEHRGILHVGRCLHEYDDMAFAMDAIRVIDFPDNTKSRLDRLSRLTEDECISVAYLLHVSSELLIDSNTRSRDRPRTDRKGREYRRDFIVETLAITDSTLSSSGVKRICKALCSESSTVRELRVTYCESVDCSCIRYICDMLPKSVISTLNLWCNDINDEGAQLLCQRVVELGCRIRWLSMHSSEKISKNCKKVCRNLLKSQSQHTRFWI